MMRNESFLDVIVSNRREDIAALEPRALRVAAERARRSCSPHPLRRALEQENGANIIAEFKRASPSSGEIRPAANIAEVVPIYEGAGACAISVLTEQRFFQGSLEDLRRARELTELPLLRKDFIVSESQIDEAAAAGADAVLLIVAVLSDLELRRLRARAEEELGLDALVEVHTSEELQRAINCGAKLIGVNNRNLRTLVTSLGVSERLASLAPAGARLVSESGISSPSHIVRLMRCGYRGFLIGESLLRAADPAALLRSLRTAGTCVKICGITNVADARLCGELGVQMVGLNFSPLSPRHISPEAGREIIAATRPEFPAMKFVGVFVDQPADFVQNLTRDLELDGVQLHGEEPPEYVHTLRAAFAIKALRVGPAFSLGIAAAYDCDAILLDGYRLNSHGGTGEAFDWSVASDLSRKLTRVILAGGLTPENVRKGIEAMRPYAVDVCSGTEEAPGRKDAEKLRRFVAAVHSESLR